LKFNNVLLNFCIFFSGKIILIFPLFEPTFYEAEGRAVKMARQAGGGACHACPELAEGLPLKYSSNFFVKRPQIVKRQRCARRGGGRGERIKASQRGNFEAAAERK